MIIMHNLSALNANNLLRKNAKAGSSSMENLSSGLRINKASDDAAGLSISEKMRGQIRGLDQASRNIQDGASLLQTAEGGLQEINDILQRQRELIIQGLNDTNTDNDRQQIEAEIQQLTQEIDSLSRRTEFNSINLLARDDYKILADRSSSNTAYTISDPPPTTRVTNSIVYKPQGTSAETRHVISSSDTSVTTNTYSNTNNISPIASPDGRAGYNEYNIDIQTTTKTDTNNTVYETLTASNDPQYATPAYWFSVGMNKTSFGPKDLGDVYGSMLENIEVNGSLRPIEYTSRSGSGSDPAWDHMWFPGTNLSIMRHRTVLADNSMEIKYVINNMDPTDANIKLDNIIAPPINSVITDAGGNPLATGNTIINPPSGSSFNLTGSDANAGLKFDDLLGFLAPSELTINNPAAGQPQINFDWQLTIPSGTSVTLGFNYGPFSLNLDVFELTHELVETKHIETTVKTDIKDIDYVPPSLDIQAGANHNQTIIIPLFNVTSQGLGIANMGILPPGIPDKTLAQIDKAIGKVINYRGMYGALQNRMEHTLNNVKNSAENLASAESRIRDADIAKEMMNFTKTNILTQAAQAMLAQANQNPQAVLQLLN
ncbi:flagellar protein [Paenibacillus odorifer]|uniref:Flagellin n=1 Tax=Paenibacillus odorifer TaxID=189426 RepID=A0A1R0ZBC0_9BACL|nr:flagellin [Paenibacillus odorifer]OME66061.1 flagellar protein [Paenibacillus odorifer]